MSKGNIKPLHDKFQILGGTHTGLSSPFDLSDKAFSDFVSLSGTHNFKTSGFQYFSELTTLITISASTEVYDAYDDASVSYTLFASEVLDSTDRLFSGFIDSEDQSDLTDDAVVNYKLFADETTNIVDELASASSIDDPVLTTDQSIIHYKIYADEGINNCDTNEAYQFQDVIDSVCIQSASVFSLHDSVLIGISGSHDVTDSVTVGVIQETLASITSASGGSYAVPLNPIDISPIDNSPTQLPVPGNVDIIYVNNPWEPSIIVDGVVYSNNVSTFPPSYGPQTTFVQWLDIDLPGSNNSSNLQDFSFRLGFDGGYFSVLSTNPLGNKGDEITIFGLKGTIVRTGEKFSNSAYGYITKGIFGTPNLNKEFNIINYGNQYYIGFVGSQILYPYVTQPNQQMTVWDMCRNIARSSNTHMGFYVVDSPYNDTLGQSGQTGLEALSSLANQVGAQLRWSGNDFYSIVYPDFHQGTFIVPSSRLLTAEGIEYETILDLGLGVTGTGVLQIPKTTAFDTDTNQVPNGSSVPTIVDQLHTIRTAVADGAPPIKLPLPAETQSAKIQIVVNDTNGTGSATGPGAGWITQNDSIWFDLGSPSISNPYVKLSDSNISYKPYVQIDSSMFPDIDAINNGEFSMNIGIERRSLGDNYDQDVENEQSRLKDLINRMLANLRFIKTYEGTINCFFYGVIPLPGMWASATDLCGNKVEGIIESVNFSAPGILTIQVAQYLRVNFLDSKSNYVSNPLNQVI